MRRKKVQLLLRNEPQGHKEYKYLYQQMLKEEIIRKAYKKLRKGKTKRKIAYEVPAFAIRGQVLGRHPFKMNIGS